MGATAGLIGPALTGANAVGQFASQQQQAAGILSQSAFQTQVAKLDATNAIARGDQQADMRESQARQTIGAQRAGEAAGGIDANSGTAADLQTDESKFSELDAQTIKNNAAREAWGYTAQAGLNAIGAQGEASSIKAQSFSTLLNGATNAYGLYRGNQQEKLGTKSPAGTGSGYGKPGTL